MWKWPTDHLFIHELQTILCKLNDLQLAMVVLRLFATDPETQQTMIKEMLCRYERFTCKKPWTVQFRYTIFYGNFFREVLGQTVDEFDSMRGKTDEDSVLSRGATRWECLHDAVGFLVSRLPVCNFLLLWFRDPFERSMAYWVLKDYTRAAHTLVEEAASGRMEHEKQETFTLANIFNFYTFLRRHPLVIRQRLTDAGSQVWRSPTHSELISRPDVLYVVYHLWIAGRFHREVPCCGQTTGSYDHSGGEKALLQNGCRTYGTRVGACLPFCISVSKLATELHRFSFFY